MFNIDRILKLLPHRYPFLMVDKILEFEKEKRMVGIKNVTFNEPYFLGHFGEYPVMPGVMIVEALAQLGCILLLQSTEEYQKIVYFRSIDKVKFRKKVRPGDVLKMEVIVTNRRGPLWKVVAKAFVDDEVVTEGELQAFVSDENLDDLKKSK
ncbi:MAG: 3-hydroxyacyl-[acyl-carrier-protein] dehydratase FabZ [Candidatus Schekmanbacteria bacterium]|nr:MAG: 3-hydroxyacyl-[acyl-carrier-protein] dehydratase FabZ [Candidatus Schekmanbacteria bacterium]